MCVAPYQPGRRGDPQNALDMALPERYRASLGFLSCRILRAARVRRYWWGAAAVLRG